MNTNENNISQSGTLTQGGNVAQQTTQDINTTQHLNRPIQPRDPRPIANEIDTDEIYTDEMIEIGEEPYGVPVISENETIDYGFREFSVKKLNYGYIIKAGCHQFAIESESRLIKVISEYIKDPSGKEKQWWETKNI